MKITLALLSIFCLTAPAFAADKAKAPAKAEAESDAELAETIERADKDAAKKAAKAPDLKPVIKGKMKTKATTRPDGLVIEDTKVGTGKEAKLGDKIKVHYKGTFKKDGKVFDSTEGKDAIEFPLVEGGLIKGWTEGIPGMRVGGKRKLSIPYALAYGKMGRPPVIPEESDLNFEVELVDVK